MISKLVPIFALLFSVSLHAESTVTLTDVHNCCKGCTNGITKAINKVDGATAAVDGKTVVITAKSETVAKKAVESLVDAGYFGTGAEAPMVKDAQVKTASIDGVHLCCAKCVTAVDKAVKSVPGVTGHDAVKGGDSIKVEGDFSTAALAAALNKAGFAGKMK